MNKVLVIAVHPDDETLGCGGTLIANKDNGDEIHWLILTDILEEHGYSAEKVASRTQEIKDVAKAYKFDSVHNLKFPTTKLDAIPLSKIISGISSVILKVEANTVYLPFLNDIHSDHRIAFQAAVGCTNNSRYSFIKRVLCMEVPSETEFATPVGLGSFSPNVFSNITSYLDRKCEIMKFYKGESEKAPFPRSEENIRALARYRGGACNSLYAEAFMLLKETL